MIFIVKKTSYSTEKGLEQGRKLHQICNSYFRITYWELHNSDENLKSKKKFRIPCGNTLSHSSLFLNMSLLPSCGFVFFFFFFFFRLHDFGSDDPSVATTLSVIVKYLAALDIFIFWQRNVLKVIAKSTASLLKLMCLFLSVVQNL